MATPTERRRKSVRFSTHNQIFEFKVCRVAKPVRCSAGSARDCSGITGMVHVQDDLAKGDEAQEPVHNRINAMVDSDENKDSAHCQPVASDPMPCMTAQCLLACCASSSALGHIVSPVACSQPVAMSWLLSFCKKKIGTFQAQLKRASGRERGGAPSTCSCMRWHGRPTCNAGCKRALQRNCKHTSWHMHADTSHSAPTFNSVPRKGSAEDSIPLLAEDYDPAEFESLIDDESPNKAFEVHKDFALESGVAMLSAV